MAWWDLPVLRICIYYYADPDPGSQKCPSGSGSRGVNTKEEKLHQKFFNLIFQNDIKKLLQINRILTFDLPVLYSPNEPEILLGLCTSWIRIRICPCRSGSGRPFLSGSGSATLLAGSDNKNSPTHQH